MIEKTTPKGVIFFIMKHRILAGLFAALTLLTALSFVACGQKAPSIDMDEVKGEINAKSVDDFVAADEKTEYVKISVTGFGSIIVRLRADIAPITVANFQKLVSEKFYNGLTFHRVFPGFMIQGGDPKGNGSGSSSEKIKGEFSVNGYDNPLLHVRGVISMARAKAYDSASCQFFLMHADSASLDGSYAAFGYIVAGLSVVDDICGIDLLYSSSDRANTTPKSPVVISSISFVQPK